MPDTSSTGALPIAGPCAAERTDVDSRCAEAERLTQAAVAHQQRARDLRRQLMEAEGKRDADARVRDRRQLSAAKDAARQTYHAQLVRATSAAEVREAARSWLREIDQMNRQFVLAERRSISMSQWTTEIEQALPQVELAADAARIAAEAAQEACMAARLTLAQCEEAALRQTDAARTDSVAQGGSDGATPIRLTSRAPAHGWVRPITIVLHGSRADLAAVAHRLAEETGVESGRLQLLLLELREQICARALEDQTLQFPQDHQFWGQFSTSDGRLIARNLAAMGYAFDGKEGWQEGNVPRVREISVAVSNVGLDPRGAMRAASQESIDSLWHGTTVLVDDYLAARAPDLDLQDMVSCLGSNSGRLSELWDMWGRLRSPLLTPA